MRTIVENSLSFRRRTLSLTFVLLPFVLGACSAPAIFTLLFPDGRSAAGFASRFAGRSASGWNQAWRERASLELRLGVQMTIVFVHIWLGVDASGLGWTLISGLGPYLPGRSLVFSKLPDDFATSEIWKLRCGRPGLPARLRV